MICEYTVEVFEAVCREEYCSRLEGNLPAP